MEVLQRNKRSQSPKVDLTAMVDLGFLLITFFMLATTFVKPKTMQVFMPEKDGDPIPYPESKTMTLLIGTRDKVYTYVLPDSIHSISDVFLDSMDYSPSGLRKLIQIRQSEVEANWGDKEKLLVIIKPLPGSSYRNTVNVLDEMLINDVKRYAIVAANTPIDSMVVGLVRETWESNEVY